jgi:SSS family solute:Na+ symporter
VVSLIENKGHHENAVDLKGVSFKTSTSFSISTLAVGLILVGFYTTWW